MKKRQFLCILLSVSMFFASLSLNASGAQIPFSDVPEGAWYREAVEYAYNHGLFNGTGKNTLLILSLHMS